MSAKPEDIERAVRHLATVVRKMGEHAGFSPAKRVEAEVTALLDGKPLPELPPPPTTTTTR
jgi:hypothetical protein